MTVHIVGLDKSIKRTICHGCGSMLEYSFVDIKTYSRKDYTGSEDSYDYIDCPVCKRHIVILSR